MDLASTAGTNEVQIISNIPYCESRGADPEKHQLDLYLPKDKKETPVLFFVHGGAWRHGDKRFLGMYSALGLFWARHGVTTVVPNYRLSPAVHHPEHIQDIARAFAWTYHNIARYGGRSDEIFVSGHSAGGHLVALLATNDIYLKSVGLGLNSIRGAIPMSGVYDLSQSNRLFDLTFGTDAKAREDAAPICHACVDAPPFLIIYADSDLALCGKEPSERFCKSLCAQHVQAETLEVKERNHATILLDALIENDPVPRAIQGFIAGHARPLP
jgi:acetyl esterase/lipase